MPSIREAGQALLDRLKKKGQDKSGNGAPEAGPTPMERLEPVAEGVEKLEAEGEEHLRGETAAVEARQLQAETESEEMKAGQGEVMTDLEKSSATAQAGLTDIKEEIAGTREQIGKMPGAVKGEFDRQQVKLDEGLEAARTGIAEQRGEALTNVAQDRAKVMDAAVQGIHGATQQQMAQIDAQVQQGTLSPSQAQAMKGRVRMGASMQLSAAVGQTAHLFTQTSAQVSTSFGSMFTQFESTAQQVQGQFGATAGSIYGQSQQAAAQFNTQLTGMDAQATAHRDLVQSQNAATRATFQNNNDQHNMAMLDYTGDQYVSGYQLAINNLEAQHMLAGDYIKTEQGMQMLEIMRQNQQMTKQGNFIQTLFSLGQMLGGG